MNDTVRHWADWGRNILREHREFELLNLFEHELAAAEDPHSVIRHWAGRTCGDLVAFQTRPRCRRLGRISDPTKTSGR